MSKIMETAKLRTVASHLGNGAEFGVASRPVLRG